MIDSVLVKESSLVGIQALFAGADRLVKWKSGRHPEYKCIEYHKKHSETEPCKSLEIIADNQVADIPEGLQVDFF